MWVAYRMLPQQCRLSEDKVLGKDTDVQIIDSTRQGFLRRFKIFIPSISAVCRILCIGIQRPELLSPQSIGDTSGKACVYMQSLQVGVPVRPIPI